MHFICMCQTKIIIFLRVRNVCRILLTSGCVGYTLPNLKKIANGWLQKKQKDTAKLRRKGAKVNSLPGLSGVQKGHIRGSADQ